MFKQIHIAYSELNENCKKILKLGINFCTYLILISSIILYIYSNIYMHPLIFTIGFNLLKYSCIFICEFLIISIISNYIYTNDIK